jgi:hypothetical protein
MGGVSNGWDQRHWFVNNLSATIIRVTASLNQKYQTKESKVLRQAKALCRHISTRYLETVEEYEPNPSRKPSHIHQKTTLENACHKNLAKDYGISPYSLAYLLLSWASFECSFHPFRMMLFPFNFHIFFDPGWPTRTCSADESGRKETRGRFLLRAVYRDQT